MPCACWSVACLLLALPAHADEGPAFDVMEFEVAGNSVLPPTTVEKAVYPFLGEKRTIADVEAARAALQRAYQQAGYLTVLVSIPEQQVSAGVVRLDVTESKLSRVRVVGSRYYDQGYIRSKAPDLKEGAVPNFQALQRDVAALNSGAGKRVVPVLRPGPQLGTTELDLNVEDKPPYHANIELNNNYSPNTTALRLLAGLRYDNLWQREHSFSFQYQTSPQDTSEVRALSAAYFAPLPGTDQLLGGYFVASRSNVAAVGDLTVLGNGSIAGARWVKPINGGSKVTQSLVLGWDYKNFDNTVALPGALASETPIHYFPVSANYSLSIAGDKGTTQLTAGLLFGLRGIGSSDADFNANRSGAHANFVVLKYSAQRTQWLPRDFALFARIDGQVADQPLISNEEYAAGGLENVRGYLEAELLGDNAVHGTVELRSPSFAGLLSRRIEDLRAHLFMDAAHLALIDPLPGQISRYTIYSTGMGLRLKARALSASLDIGVPLKDTTYTHSGEPRLQFLAGYEF